MVLAERSGRSFMVFCQAAISFHILAPCYRHSCIIGIVFHEIDRGTLPIIYHLGRKTVPISPLYGRIWAVPLLYIYEQISVILSPPDDNNEACQMRFRSDHAVGIRGRDIRREKRSGVCLRIADDL